MLLSRIQTFASGVNKDSKDMNRLLKQTEDNKQHQPKGMKGVCVYGQDNLG